MKVSVPSRGLSYLNEIQRNEKIQFISFRPLTGTLLSKLKFLILTTILQFLVSVPSRGLSYLNITKELGAKIVVGFRPLTGTLLSKHHPPILPPQAAFFAGLRGK